MRRLLSLLSVTACAVVALPSAANASADTYGVGGGKVLGGVATFSFSGHEGPNGDFGQFQLKFSDGSLDLRTDVTCVNVFGMRNAGGAWMSSVIKSVNADNALLLEPGDPITWIVNDGGNPSIAPVDYVNGFTVEADCKLLPPNFNPPDVTSGNVVIKND